MYYTLNTFEKLFNELSKELGTSKSTLKTEDSINPKYTNDGYFLNQSKGSVEIELLENGKQQLTFNTIGHNPKNIQVNVTEDSINILAKKEEGTSRFVKDIDLTLTLASDYDGTKSEARFENGLLTLLIDKKTDRKSKTLKISY